MMMICEVLKMFATIKTTMRPSFFTCYNGSPCAPLSLAHVPANDGDDQIVKITYCTGIQNCVGVVVHHHVCAGANVTPPIFPHNGESHDQTNGKT